MNSPVTIETDCHAIRKIIEPLAEAPMLVVTFGRDRAAYLALKVSAQESQPKPRVLSEPCLADLACAS
jgi:hypothetical protein